MAEGQAAFVDRASFDQLQRDHKLLREDFERLVDRIGHAQTCYETSWRYHREKFRAAQLRSPLGHNGPSLPNTLTIKPLRLVQRLCGGREEMLALREVSTSSRASAESVFIGYDLYVCGGLDGFRGNGVESADCFHLQDQVWEPLPPCSLTRTGGAGAMLDGYFYTCGSGLCGKAAWRLNLAGRTWEQLAVMNERRSNSAAALVGGRLYMCGGEDPVENLVHDSVEYFDALAPNPRNPHRAGVWRVLPATMSARRRCCGAAAIGGAGRPDLFLCGGTPTPSSRDAERCGCEALTSVEVLELREPEPSLRSLPPMPEPRSSHVVACLRGRVYACGGQTGGGVALSTVDSYDPAAEAWSSSPPMPLARAHAAATIVTGRLLVLGGMHCGCPGTPAERAVQRFDPTAGAWEVLDWELVHGRCDFCAGAVWRGVLAA